MKNLNEKVTLANYSKGVIIGFEYKGDNRNGAVLMSNTPLNDRPDFLRYEVLLNNGQILFFTESDIIEGARYIETFGIVSKENGYIDISSSLLGAKNHATRNGYTQIFKRFNSGYHVELASDKTLDYWVDSKDFEKFFGGIDLDCSLCLAVNSVLDGVLTLKQAVDEYEYKGL